MRKILTILLTVCMLVCTAMGLTACTSNAPSGGGLSGAVNNGCQHNLTYFSAVEGGCYQEGLLAYYHCDKCKKYFLDAEGKTETTYEAVYLGYKHVGSTHYDAVTATCTQVGNVEYTYCPTCSRYLDANGNGIDRNVTPLYTINAHEFENGVCTVCDSRMPSVGLAIDNYGMVCGIGDCQDKDIIIPNSYEKDGKIFPVMGIDRYAFDGANDGVDINSVRITKGVGIIKRNAFFNLNNLKTVVIEGKIDFEGDAFYACRNIETIELGEGITELVDLNDSNYYNVFTNSASNLQNLYLPSTYNSSSLGGIYSWQIENFNTYCGGIYLGNQTNPYVYLAGAVNGEAAVTAIHQNCKIIGDEAFNSNYLGGYFITCEIPDSVKIIGEYAFKGAVINAGSPFLNISENVEFIGKGAFGGGNNAFVVDQDNENFKSENYSLLSRDGKRLIAACQINFDDEDTSIITTYVVPAGVEEIDDYVFFGHGNLNGVILPSTLKEIGNGAFKNCENLITVTIPSSVEFIGRCVFDINTIIYVEREKSECELYSNEWVLDENQGYAYNEKVIFNSINNDVAKDGNVYVVTDNFIYTVSDGRAAIYSLGAAAITEDNLVLPESVIYKSVTYPVTSVKSAIISELTCKSLTIPDCYVEITDLIDQWGYAVNIMSDTITEIVLGSGLNVIPNFNINLTSFKYNGSVDSWLNKTFVNRQNSFLSDDTKIYIKQGDEYVELTSVTISSGSVYNGQFGDSNSIEEIIVKYGGSISSFGSWSYSQNTAFSNNPTIKLEYFEGEISVSMSKATIVYEYGATSGETDDFDYKILGERAKITAYKGSATNVVIPQKIGGLNVVDFGTVFSGNTTIKTVAILARVGEIKQGAFANCTNLEVVYINGYVDKIKTGAFTNLNINTNFASYEGVDYLTTGIYIGSNEQTTESNWIDKAYPVHYEYSYDDVSNILYLVDGNNRTIIRYMGTANTLTIPNDKNFTAIRSYAFMNCNLTEVIISNTIIEIGVGAFENSVNLTSVSISSSVNTIGADAFKGTSLTEATFENKEGWTLIDYSTLAGSAVDKTILENTQSAASYLKEKVTDGYALIWGVAV